MKLISDLKKLDKSALSVVHTFDNFEENKFWRSRTPLERMAHIETLRRINYGDKATARLQRVLSIAKGKAS